MVALIEMYRNLVREYNAYLMKDTELTDADRIELKWRRFSYYVFLFFIVAVGVPVWYFTTTSYRAPLPYFEEEFRERVKAMFAEQHLLPELNNYSSSVGDVWSQMTLSSRYNLHFIFVHADGVDLNEDEPSFDVNHKRWFLESIRKYAAIFNESIEIELSAEHFWDFSLLEFLNQFYSNSAAVLEDKNSVVTTLLVKSSMVSTLTTEIDRLSTPLIGSDALIKIVVFLPKTNERILFVDENEKDTKGLIVASWGGFVSYSIEKTDIIPTKNELASINTIFGILRTQLGIFAARQRLQSSELADLLLSTKCESVKCSTFKIDAIFHKIQLTVENLGRTIHFINSLHDLAAKIEDLVISDEVAKLANAAYENFFLAYNSLIIRRQIDFDSLASIRAKTFAEQAITHPSLLEYLNFPSDQKYGIYVPLFFPALVPICFPFVSFILFLLRRIVRRNATKSDTMVVDDNASKILKSD